MKTHLELSPDEIRRIVLNYLVQERKIFGFRTLNTTTSKSDLITEFQWNGDHSCVIRQHNQESTEERPIFDTDESGEL